MAKPIITDFTAGELSPRMAGRFDITAYSKGARSLENWVPFLQGGVTTRPGFKYVGTCKANASGVRLIPFIVSDTQSYVIEMGVVSGVGYMRFWHDDAILKSNGNDVTFTSRDNPLLFPYTTMAQINEIQVAQDGKVLYMAQRGFAPRKLTNGSGDTFTLAALTVPLFPSSEYPGCVAIWGGRLWWASTSTYTQRIWASEVWGTNSGYDYYDLHEDVSVTNLVAKDPQAAWTITGTIAEGSAKMTNVWAAYMATLSIGDVVFNACFGENGAATIIAFGVDESGSALADDEFMVSINADSTVTGGFFTVKCNSDNVPEYVEETTTKEVITDANAMDFTIGSDQIEKILWMAPGVNLVVGTATSEWIIPQGVTALEPAAILQTRYGSSPVQGRLFNQSILFFQSGGKRLREYIYLDQNAAYQSPEVTFLSEHILSSTGSTNGIVAMDFSQSWQPMVYCVRYDGTMAVLVYSREYGVSAWCRFVISGTIVSVAVIVDNDGIDNVYVATVRGGVYYIERLDPILAPVYNLDSYSIVTKSTTNTIARFASQTVSIVSGSTVYTATANAQGQITMPVGIQDGTSVGVGLSYTCKGETTRLLKQAQLEPGMSNIKRIINAVFLLLSSYSFEASTDELTWDAVTLTGAYTGDAKVDVSGTHDSDASLSFRQTLPLPVTILAIVPEVI